MSNETWMEALRVVLREIRNILKGEKPNEK